MYRAPVSDITFTLKHVAGLSNTIAEGAFPELSEDLVDAVIAEAGRFASEELSPLNRVGDLEGARLVDGAVATPTGWRRAYEDWCAGGWNGLAAPEDFGGQGLPRSLSTAVHEIWNGGCMAFALCPLLTAGAIDALLQHGSDTLKAQYLPKLVSGTWTATMNLTEPQAGSDLGALTTRAEPRGDGTYRLFGQKIFITYGEHDLAENIVHLVLARLPDAPAGSKGISLFLVPKFLVADDGAIGERNDVVCAGLEKKLGIHGSPTCTMHYGDGRFGDEAGAIGWLVGEEHRGLHCMFTMMNAARLAVGIQGVGQAELALQQASAYANERRQGRAPGATGTDMSLIAEHPDVRRMLMTMRALTEASRALCYCCALAADLGDRTRVDLLTPVAKAFSTDAGVEVASLGIQVHGGAGYIEQTGAAQILRDSRIAPIYEGTNGIQAIDLVMRKLPLEDGGVLRKLVAELRAIAEQARGANREDFGQLGMRVAASLDDLEGASSHLLALLQAGKMAEALAGAAPYLRLFGLAVGGAYLAKGALAARDDSTAHGKLRIATARFMAERLIPETAALKGAVIDGAEAVLGVDAALFAEPQ